MKKLENEYRQLMQSETPDLWSRIEAGIDAKIAEEKSAEKKPLEEKPVRKEKTGVKIWKRYSLPLAACIAAIICVPLLLTGFIRMASGGKATTTESAADYAAADCAAPEETTSVTMDCADEPAAAIVTEESCDEEIDDAFVEMESASVENEETMLDGAVTETTTESATEDSKQSAEDLAGLKQILTIIQISQGNEADDENRVKGIIYSLNTEEVGECTLFVPADAEFVTDMNSSITIRVETGNEEYDFVFVEIVD